MKQSISPTVTKLDFSECESSELLILPDGRILVHNLTPVFANLLHDLNPDDGQIRSRVQQVTRQTSSPNELPD